MALFGGTALLYTPLLNNVLEGDDAWNYVLQGELGVRGVSAYVASDGYFKHQNVHRLLADATWLPRYGLFGVWMPGWNAPSMLLHALNAVLVALLARALRPERGLEVPLAAGALAALAPLHVHTVAWIGGTYDLLAGAAQLGACLAFLGRRQGLAVSLTLAAVTSKESGLLVVPLLTVVWLAAQRTEGLRRGAQRLLPHLAVAVAVAALRRLQVAEVGVVTDAMAAVRSVGLDPLALVTTAPLAAGAALVSPLEALGLEATTQGLVGLGVLVATAIAARSPLGVVGALGALGLAVPPVLLREYGHALDLDEILHNPRYLYGAQLFGALALAEGVLHGARAMTARRTALLLVAVGSLAATLDRVAVATRPASAAGALLATVEPLRAGGIPSATEPLGGPSHEPLRASRAQRAPDEAPRLWLLTNRQREDTYRLAVSRWLAVHTGLRVQWVQRGTLRVLERDPAKTDGLDFVNAYHRARPAPFSPSEVADGEPVLLVVDRGPASGHRVEAVALAEPLDRGLAAPVPVDLGGATTPSAASGDPPPSRPHEVSHDTGALRLTLRDPPTHPAGEARVPAVVLPVLLDPQRTVGLRVTYDAALGARPYQPERRFMRGYLEVGLSGPGLGGEEGVLLLPLVFDGAKHTETLRLDVDPLVRGAQHITRVGFSLDQASQVTVYALEALVVPGVRSGAP